MHCSSNSAFERFAAKPVLIDAVDRSCVQRRLLHFRREISGDENERRNSWPLPKYRADDIDARLRSKPVVGDHNIIPAGCYAFTGGHAGRCASRPYGISVKTGQEARDGFVIVGAVIDNENMDFGAAWSRHWSGFNV